MTAWAHLPNAQHIDWVLADLENRPHVWVAARAAAWDAARAAAWGAARVAAWDAARAAARGAARVAAWDAARAATWAAGGGAARIAAQDANFALIIYDKASVLTECDIDHLKRLYRLSPQPMYLLMQPFVFARNSK